MGRPIRPMAVILCFVIGILSPTFAAMNPNEKLDDPRLETRAREISKELRCLVCQNQSIDDSDAELARDLRVLVRERLVAGDSNEQVFAYVVERYGEYVLMTPRLSVSTLALWFGPLAVLIVGGGIVLFALRRHKTRQAEGAEPLSDEEKVRLSALLQDRVKDRENPPSA